jgi:hypothetical protein
LKSFDHRVKVIKEQEEKVNRREEQMHQIAHLQMRRKREEESKARGKEKQVTLCVICK